MATDRNQHIDDGPSEMSDESQAQQDPPTSTLHSAFVVLRALGRIQRHPVGVTRLAAETGIPKTTVHRLLEQLAEENIVQRDEGKWTFGSGLSELDVRHSDLAGVARPWLRTMSLATGASIFLYDATGDRLTAMSREYGSRFATILTPSEQRRVAEGPGSAASQALRSGQMAVEYGADHRESSCIATPFALPSGEPAVLSFGLPAGSRLEEFKRPLDRIGKLIQSDMRRLES